ncbi:MAG TPA: hypothetical protein VFX98_03590 [Longimicrobiaceae bacterium]|nr:hypothetical protein [Longimicrobiaceae bacterium]
MRKLTLDLEDLTVESFQTADGDDAARGTVHGQAVTVPFSCNNPCTFDSDCGGTCYNSCPETCMSCEGETCWC